MAFIRDTTSNGATWAAVNVEALSYAMVQLKTDGPVLVQVAQSQPSAADVQGVTLAAGELQELPLPGLVAGDIVYLKSTQGEDNTCAVFGTLAAVVDG